MSYMSMAALRQVVVALRKESVDRNIKQMPLIRLCLGSLSARRAWIEISTVIVIFFKRNTSLSARRAWIEMQDDGD